MINNCSNKSLVNNKISYSNLSMCEMLENSANINSSNTALRYYGRKIKYNDFIKYINIVAKSLKSLGIRKWDRVTICTTNTVEAIICFYAINMIGAISTLIHPLSSINEIKYYVKISKSKHILTLDIFLKKVMEAVKDLDIEKIIVSNMKLGKLYIKVIR